MPKLLIAFASATLLLASSGIWKANAATITNAGSLAPLTKSYTPVEKVLFHFDDTIAVAIRYGCRYLMVMDIGPTTVTATAIGHTVIMATAGDQASASVSDPAGAGATKAIL